MILPLRLKKGDTVGIVSPSKYLDQDSQFMLQRASAVLESFGLHVRLAKYALAVDQYHYSAGTPQERVEDIHQMFTDPEVKAIWCAQGGQTANMVLDLLDYNLIASHPKIFIGLSDNTVLINAIHEKTGLVTFHGPDPKAYPPEQTFAKKYSQEEFVDRLINAKIGPVRKISDWKSVRSGTAQGKLVGGNLRSLLKLAGTEYFPDMSGKILLLEAFRIGIEESLYMLTRLQQMKVFEGIAGCVVGYMFSFQHEYNTIAQFEDILLEVSKDYSFPILKINEFGHRTHNTFLPIGGAAHMDADKKVFELMKPCVL